MSMSEQKPSKIVLSLQKCKGLSLLPVPLNFHHSLQWPRHGRELAVASLANVTQEQLVEELGEAECAGTWLGVPEVGVHLLSLPRVHSVLCPIQSYVEGWRLA